MMRKNNTFVIVIETEEIAWRIFRVDLSWTIFGIVVDKSHQTIQGMMQYNLNIKIKHRESLN